MRQKYVLVKKDADQVMLIREFAELDKEQMSLLCEETYPIEEMKAAIAGGKAALVDALRTDNMYPPSVYSDKIADSVTALINDKDRNELALYFDDMELVTKERQSAVIIDDTPENEAP